MQNQPCTGFPTSVNNLNIPSYGMFALYHWKALKCGEFRTSLQNPLSFDSLNSRTMYGLALMWSFCVFLGCENIKRVAIEMAEE